MSFRTTIMTPEARVLDEDVESLVLPGGDGLFGVLDRHAPMVAKLNAGIVTVESGAVTSFYVVGEGLVEVGGNRVLVLTDTAIKAGSLADAEFRREELQRARGRLPLVSVDSLGE